MPAGSRLGFSGCLSLMGQPCIRILRQFFKSVDCRPARARMRACESSSTSINGLNDQEGEKGG